MNKALILALALLPGSAFAVICKSVGADGVVSYTDVPARECSQKVELPDYSRYAPRPVEQKRAGQQANSPASASVVNFQRYERITVDQPKTGGVVRSNEGIVTVVIGLEPSLQPGHRVQLTLDGRPVAGSFDGLAIDLSGVDRGTHTLRASVTDPSGKVLIATGPSTFTLRKTGLTDSNAAADDPKPPPTPDPGFPAPGTSPDYAPEKADFSPGAPPNFTPPPTPGYGAGSSFTPKFTP